MGLLQRLLVPFLFVSSGFFFSTCVLVLFETYLVLVGTEAEVLDGLTGVLGATEQQGVGTGGLLQGKLVKGDGRAASSQDAGTSSGGETQGGDVHLGDSEQTGVIGDGANDDDGLLLVAVLNVGVDAGQRNGRAVHAGHKQTAQDDLVEGRVGTAYRDVIHGQRLCRQIVSSVGMDGSELTGQEAVQLHQELQVGIVALGRLAVSAAHVVAVEIDTCKQTKRFLVSLWVLVCSKRVGSTREGSQRRLATIFFSPSLNPGSACIPLREEGPAKPGSA